MAAIHLGTPVMTGQFRSLRTFEFPLHPEPPRHWLDDVIHVWSTAELDERPTGMRGMSVLYDPIRLRVDIDVDSYDTDGGAAWLRALIDQTNKLYP